MNKRKLSVLGIIIVLAVCCVYFFFSYKNIKKYKPFEIIRAAEEMVYHHFPKIEIKETGVGPSEEYVNFVYDELYQVDMVYVINGDFKKIVFQVGVFNGSLMMPSEMELLILDEDASVIVSRKNELSGSRSE